MPGPQTPPRIQRGIPPRLHDAAAALYWRHFGTQILPWPATARQGVALVRAAMRPEQALVALAPSGRLVGMAGLRDAGGGFLAPHAKGFVAVWGPARGRLRHLATGLYRPGAETADLVLDGIAVRLQWRRQGIARALIGAAAAHARRLGHPALRAEVEAGNHGGLAAWQAMGFQPLARQRLGWPWSAPAHVLRLAL
ncbi:MULTISPECIES: GNAT family N-acetyltransferase [Paracoccus]|jgi:GNAT superfamily N-acetyltransferase|uniref:GNAT family N-acetyltransferase n=1 Tax=Paracoccus TaxID=265 RepID=UPI0025826156|nr:GNAT family N-acetyltransferase [Paracoccus sp. (in: a-proteobacteria)]